MSKKLVAYFSASGVTAQLAAKLASAVKGDLYEILPKEPYTSSDLDWTNDRSRSTVEMNDKAYRPAIANTIKDMGVYDVIYIGFPIWWYVAPTIINTFLESYDLTGKTIIPFATSGGSGMSKVNHDLIGSLKGAVLKTGRRFDTSVSIQELQTWAESAEA